MSRKPLVAVTGATGFLGLHVVAALARTGARIRILARRDPVHELWRGLTLDVVPGRLEDRLALERLVTGADAVVHGAGLIKARNRAHFMRVNADGTRAVARAARILAPESRFVAISSLAAREPQLSDYAASKRAGEDAARAAYAGAEEQLVIVRPSVIYGPWDRETLAIFKVVSRPLVPVFDVGRTAIIHVSDAAGAIAQLALATRGEVGTDGLYSLADPDPAGHTLRGLLGEAALAVSRRPCFMPVPKAALRAAGKLSTWWGIVGGHTPIFTSGKVAEILHPDWSIAPHELLPPAIYKAKIGISQGFHETALWYRAAKWLA